MNVLQMHDYELSFATLIGVFLIASGLTWLIAITVKWHGRWTTDSVGGVQKFHRGQVPRVGGVAVFIAVALGFYVHSDLRFQNDFMPIIGGAFLVLFIGLFEDISKRASVYFRLVNMAVASLLVIWLSSIWITRVDIFWLDQCLRWWPLAALLTVIAVVGVSNAVNIMDGFNGLASGMTIILLLWFAAIGLHQQDFDLAEYALIMVAAIGGFMVVNFPWGRIFMGDGGAYLMGFCLAWIAIFLPARNELVSPWASLLICAYPIVEVLYSIQRRIRAKVSSTQPDHLHLHSLIKMRVVRRYMLSYPAFIRNSAVAPLVWLMNGFLGWLAYTFMTDTVALIICFVVFVTVYVITYRALLLLPEVAVDAVGHDHGAWGH